MEAQPQRSASQTPLPPNKPRIFIISVLAVLLAAGGFWLYQAAKQERKSQELIGRFSDYLEQHEYAAAYDILNNLEGQGLGSYRQGTKASLDGLLGLMLADLTRIILAEKSQDFAAYEQYKGLQLLFAYPETRAALASQIKAVTGEYLAGDMEYAQIEYFFQNLVRLGFSHDVLRESRETVELCRQSREKTRKGQELFAAGDYRGALEKFGQVSEEYEDTFAIAQIGINQSLGRIYSEVERLSRRGEYSQALESLKQLQTIFPETPEISQKIESVQTAWQEAEKNLVLYTGPVEHIFFHPLIAYPELTFDGDLQERGFNEWFVTIPEFEKIIKSLYSKGFILIKITDLYDISQEGDREIIVPKQLKLPKGKRPLVISVDDLNYYRYMIQNGTVHKLILDQEKVATYSRDPQGKEITAYNNEIIPILDSFVEEHPDFSFRGAKGVIALTGYEGILGYRTDDVGSPGFEAEKEEALKVIQALRDNGWLFASHSQGHINVRENTYEKVVRDTERWQREVESLIGPTPVYIYPFGASVRPDDPKFKYLQEAGFKIFCSVGPNPYLKYAENYILMDRRHIDGIALLRQAESLEELFNSEEIIDPLRPPLE